MALLLKMKIVAISDTHCRHHSLRLPKADAIIHAGDVTSRGKESEVMDFMAWFSKLNYRYKIFIAGNHDFFFETKNAAILQKHIPPNVIYLNDSGAEIEGLKLWGSPITPWFYNWAFNKPRGQSIKKHWDLIPADTDILITHGPPYGILDITIENRHTGCKDLLKTVEAIKPKAHVFGHIHESYGLKRKGETLFINACILNESYELLHKPVLFEA
jgi:Icc-related predicted phosphoesterase